MPTVPAWRQGQTKFAMIGAGHNLSTNHFLLV